MDRLNQLRGDVGGSREPSLDGSSLAGEAYLTANESSKYFSLSQIDSSASSSPPKETAADVITSNSLSDAERIISNLSPIPKKSELDSFKIGEQIEAANILSGGVNIFDDNDNSYDGDELVIDDAAMETDDKTAELKISDDTGENLEKTDRLADTNTEEAEAAGTSKDTEVVLQIDGKNVDAIDIGNGLYLYRKDGEEELAAVQILDDNQQQPDIKFLKVRENAEGNLEVYEEIEIEVPKEMPVKEGKVVKNPPHTPEKNVCSEPAKAPENKNQTAPKDTDINELVLDTNNDNSHIESKTEVNLNGKMIKFSESRKSPLIGTFTPMTYHSTPNKEGIPLTKTMVDLQLHPSRHSENVKKTIEVHTDNGKHRISEPLNRNTKDTTEHNKRSEFVSSTLDKDDQNNEENIKQSLCSIDENKSDDTIFSNNDKKMHNKTLLSEETKPIDKNDVENKVIKDDKTDIAKEESSSSVGAQSNFDNENNIEREKPNCGEIINETKNIDETCSKTTNDLTETEPQIHDLKTNDSEEKREEHSKSVNDQVKDDVLKCAVVEEIETTTDDDKCNSNINICNQNKSDMDIKTNSNELPQSSEKVDMSTKDVKIQDNTEIKDSKNLTAQSDSGDNGGKNIDFIITSGQTELRKEIELINSKAIETEVKNDILLHEPESSRNITHEIAKSKQQKTISDKQQHNEHVHNVSVPVEKKNYIPFKTDSKLAANIQHFSKTLTVNESTEVEASVNKTEIKSDLISTGSLKTVDADLKQPVYKHQEKDSEHKVLNSISSKLSRKSCEVRNLDNKSTQKALLNIEQKDAPNPSTQVKTNNAGKEDSNKNECKQKLPILIKNTKDPTSDLKTHLPIQNIQNQFERNRNDCKKEPTKESKASTSVPINNNKTEVPFGKWTEENRQIFLNKIKEAKVPTNTSNTKQLKQPNDLNRRDVLQKIDSQRQSNIASAKAQELNALNKMKLKHETATFGSKSNIIQKEKNKDSKNVTSFLKDGSAPITSIKNICKQSKTGDPASSKPIIPVETVNVALTVKKDSVRRKEINNQDLIDQTVEGIINNKTLEGFINRAVTGKLGQGDVKQSTDPIEKSKNAMSYNPVSLDEIESKMNELHGIPFTERPPHQLPQVVEHENKGINNVSTASISNKMSVTHKPQHKIIPSVGTRTHDDSDEEIIEHVPVTGDLRLNKNTVSGRGTSKTHVFESQTKQNSESKKETIITENDFEKFARRNSITYENCLTVNFDGKEQHNVFQTVVEKESVPKKLTRNEIMLAESKAKCNKHLTSRPTNVSSKIPTMLKQANNEESNNKNYQSKVQIAYQSVMTAKRQQECPISIIEDKPVKVVFMDGNHEYAPHQLNVQGKELSPPKKSVDWDNFMHSNSESLDSSEFALDAGYDSKSQDDIKFKSKHQRKQVLTPVEAPDLELIEPGDLGIDVSPKKKRKTDDNKSEKSSKSLVPKKSYLLNRNITTDVVASNSHDLTKSDPVPQQDVFLKHSDPISAIDNLVKAAELLENQTETKNVLPASANSSPTQQNNPVKRGRGRPRKYPLPETGSGKNSPSPVKTPSPQKRPRLIDAKVPKYETDSEDDEIINEDQLIKENWSMGKINKNIVCPICNKLFRTEYVVFKHVRHCTGSSPGRSDSDKRSPRRMRQSQELDWKSEGSKSDSGDIDEDYESTKLTTEKRESKENRSSIDDTSDVKANIIEIEDTPLKDKPPITKRENVKTESNKTIINKKSQPQVNNLVCEFCGKTFRQLSYLVNHKLQHKNTESKRVENDNVHKSLFSCEVCKKEFRKLHHLVQHRNIHSSTRSSRKNSSEYIESKSVKDSSRANEDQTAGFRCEPCDKSFRKLHHLVEHRETHDEINKKCNPAASGADTGRPNPSHHCDICKKTFKKLQHLVDHKEQHLDTSSEKSDDKSVKSSLSTRDIIHECPLCYMVFPNEHSLNKHHIICQRKKKQSAAKQSKQINENEVADIENESQATEDDENPIITAKINDIDESCVLVSDKLEALAEKQEAKNIHDIPNLGSEDKKDVDLDNLKESTNIDLYVKPEIDIKTQYPAKQNKSTNKKENRERIADKVLMKAKKHISLATEPVEIINIPDTPTPKKRVINKDKLAPTVTKRQKTTNPLPAEATVKTPETSDDEEVRYMLNPDFKVDESNEGKMFMKVRAKKRNSLQIERPNSKDLMKRRISLQHPPKIPRLKVKPIPRKPPNTVVKNTRTSTEPVEPVQSTDSDDSDVKYSFPESVKKEMALVEQKKIKKQTTIEKRKSLSIIAKRKSLGKTISNKRKVNASPDKQIKKRSREVEHRCDCGQLFSSAALLSRHTSLAHTPPRIRRRRSPPPDPPAKRPDKSHEAPKVSKPNTSAKTGVSTRKSSTHGDVKTSANPRKSSGQPKSAVKTPRSAAHKGVPVPEKMRKLMEKSKK